MRKSSKGNRPLPKKDRARRAPRAVSAVRVRPFGASKPIWQGLAKALQTEPRDETTIRGATGLEHKVLQIAVDEKTDRLLVFTAEPDPRMAALVQHDIQSTLSPKTRVLVARPLVVDLGVITRKLVEVIGRRAFRMSELNRQINRMNSMPQAQREEFTHSLLGEIAGGHSGRCSSTLQCRP